MVEQERGAELINPARAGIARATLTSGAQH